MKGKRYATEDNIRILRDTDREKGIPEVCRAHNISEGSLRVGSAGSDRWNSARRVLAARERSPISGSAHCLKLVRF
jgi:hypothetical protein